MNLFDQDCQSYSKNEFFEESKFEKSLIILHISIAKKIGTGTHFRKVH